MLLSYSCMVLALFLAKMPCTESMGLGRGVRAKCQVLLAVLHGASCPMAPVPDPVGCSG